MVSLGKSIVVLRVEDLNNNELFRFLRIILTFILFLPIWLSVLFDTQISDEGRYSTIEILFGILLSLTILSITFIYEYRKRIRSSKNIIVKKILYPIVDAIDKDSNSNQNLTKRRRRWNVIQVIFGLTLYILVIISNFPSSFIANILPDCLVASTLIYVILLIWIFTLILGYATYKFDKYYEKNINSKNFKYKLRFPTILALIIFSVIVYWLAGVDHYFKLENSRLSFTELSNYEENFKVALGNRLCPEEFKTDNKCTTEQSLVVVAASGGGIQASGWTAEVLSGLQDKIGTDFTQSIGLISSVSGGSVGTMFYLDSLKDGKDGVVSDSKKLLNNATADWLDSVGWGLAYPDLVRAIGLPFLTFNNPYLDRGYSLEKDWEHTLSKPDQTIDDWYEQAKQGEIPIPVFNSTLVENGYRFLISPFKFLPGTISDHLANIDLQQSRTESIQQAKALDFRTLYNNCGSSDNELCNLSIETAARLSATFPYVSPMARNDKDNKIQDVEQNYHMADGGYFDNAGAYTAIEWLDNILNKYADNLNIKKVVLLQINAFPIPTLESDQKGFSGLKTVSIAPLLALNGVRDSTQRARNIQEARLLEAKWKNQVDIEMFALSFPERDQNGKKYNPPLSWRLTPSEKDNLDDAWNNDPTIRKTVKSIKVFWQKKNESTAVEQS